MIATTFRAAHPSRAAEPDPVAPRLTNSQQLGDFDAMLERRVIRVLVPPGRTLYFNDRGHERGVTAETVRDFETFINKKYRKRLNNRPVTVVLIPTRRDQLIAHLADGLGDIAAGNLTETPERLFRVDFFTPPDLRAVSEVVITGKKAGSLARAEDLSGRTVYVRKSSSYFSSLQALNSRLAASGAAPVRIVPVHEALEDEDIMEMVDAGLIDATVADDWLAKMWAKVLPGMIINSAAAVRTNGRVGWAVRKKSPLLLAELTAFHEQNRKTGAFAYRLAQYNKKVKKLRDPTGHEDWNRFQETVALFEKYGDQYGFDPLMLAALGFQESRLDQGARSSTGAVGIMQVMPATGASMKVGDITVAESNIHAGAKYMNELMTKYFKQAQFDELNRTLFAFASYNAGPNRIATLRETASARGFDPDLWFDNVEVVVSEKVGRETTTYVRNILKYYVSYTLMLERLHEQKRASEEIKKGH
ncbi:MAG TPA: transglycosylase SLT domain-containing protein [Candidatus Krumholzibacteria bacterium]